MEADFASAGFGAVLWARGTKSTVGTPCHDKKAQPPILSCIPRSTHFPPTPLPQGVVHSGGVLADAALPNQTLHGLRAAFAPKASSAQLWQQPVGLQPSAMHLLFSSVAALLGSPGQANYSAANASLDAMARIWQSQVRDSSGGTWG